MTTRDELEREVAMAMHAAWLSSRPADSAMRTWDGLDESMRADYLASARAAIAVCERHYAAREHALEVQIATARNELAKCRDLSAARQREITALIARAHKAECRIGELEQGAPPALVVTDAMVEAGAKSMWEQRPEFSAPVRAYYADARACLTAALGTPQPAQASDIAVAIESEAARLDKAGANAPLVEGMRAASMARNGGSVVNVPWCHECDSPDHSGPCEKPAHASEPARVEVGAFRAAVTAYRNARRDTGEPWDSDEGIAAGLRAAFAAANVVPRSELEAMRVARDAWQEEIADALGLVDHAEGQGPQRASLQNCASEIAGRLSDLDMWRDRADKGEALAKRLRADLAAATQRVGVLNKRLRALSTAWNDLRSERDQLAERVRELEAVDRDIADERRVALEVMRERDEARAALGRVMRVSRDALVDAFMRSPTPAEDTTFGWFADTALAVFAAALGAPAAEPEPVAVMKLVPIPENPLPRALTEAEWAHVREYIAEKYGTGEEPAPSWGTSGTGIATSEPITSKPAAEPAPAPVTREQFEALWNAVDSLRCAAHAAALDDHARKDHLRDADRALEAAKGE